MWPERIRGCLSVLKCGGLSTEGRRAATGAFWPKKTVCKISAAGGDTAFPSRVPLHLGSAGGPPAAYRIPILPCPSNHGCYTRRQCAQLTVGVPILPCSTCDQITQLQTIGHEGKPTRDFCSSSALWTKRGRLSSLLPPSSLYLEWQGQLKVEWPPCDPEAPRG